MSDFSLRDPAAGVDPLFHQRWSPRSFVKKGLSSDVLARLLDAARWSPSCFNAQPWRFYTSTEATFSEYLDLLMEGNQVWAKNAEVIGFMVASLNFEHNGEANPYAEFDCGAAWMALTLQAQAEGLYTHGMGGIHHDQVAQYLNLSGDTHKVVMGFAIGHIGPRDALPHDLAERETPSPRKPLSELWNKG
ncbi:MAG: nitroreductase family protein [Halieaceae bacterium]|jgi:nitroreductase|nr:nitroreductase family protein [Halieaceae bacterium]